MAKSNKGRKFFATTATAALVASAIVPVASAAQINDFNSISPYAQEAVQDLNDRGIIKGDQKGNFNPKSAITRAEAATILANALELEGSGSTSFTDVNKSAWYYDAIDAAVANGIFQGQGAGKFNPSANLTRSEAAIILVDAFGLEGTADLKEFKDEASVKSWAEEALSIAVKNGVMKGDDNGNLKPNASITRQDFALMYYRTEAAEGTDEVSGSVKAINNTTVEVTFEDAIDDIKALDFAIEGLEVSNAVVKQTDKKTAVLTTSAQTADVEYTVTVNGEAIGKFKGISAVIPTKITTTTTSLQGVIGEQVTVKAQVTVAEGQSKAGIPVTFNIVNDQKTNDKIEVEVATKEDGVATYSYTRYYGSEDTVTAYATKKSSVFDTAKVYWANTKQLVVSEITTGNELANNTKKSYKVTGKANATYYIAIKENLGVNPDKVKKVFVQDSTTGDFVTPREILDNPNGNVYATVTTNAKGEGAFTVHAANEEATPIVYAPETTPVSANATKHERTVYNRLDLQSQAPTVKFSQVNALQISVVGEGTANAAEYIGNVAPTSQTATSVGGRTYTVTVNTKDGKVAPAGTVVYVAFKSNNYSDLASDAQYFATGKDNFKKIDKNLAPQQLVVGKDGKVQFRVAGKGSTSFVKPTVFADTAGSKDKVELDTTDVQQDAEITYFKAPSVVNAALTVEDQFGRQVTSVTSGQVVNFVYQSVDQNGFPYQPVKNQVTGGQEYYKQVQAGTDAAGNPIYIWVKETSPIIENPITEDYVLAFDVNSTFGNVVVSGEGVQKPDNTNTYKVKSKNGKAVIQVTTTLADTVRVNVTGVNNILPTVSASVSFVGKSEVPNLFTGNVEFYNSAKAELKFAGLYDKVKIDGEKVYYKVGQTYLADYAAFINVLRNATGGVQLTREVKNDVTTFTVNSTNVPGVAKPVDESLEIPVAESLVFTSTEAITAGDVSVKGEVVGTVAATATADSYKITFKLGKAKPTANFEATIGGKAYDFVTTDNGATWTATAKASEVTGVTLSEITNFVNLTAFGKIAVVIEPAQLPEALKGAETLVLTVKGTDYELPLEKNEYFISIPVANGLTVDDVKAGKVNKK